MKYPKKVLDALRKTIFGRWADILEEGASKQSCSLCRVMEFCRLCPLDFYAGRCGDPESPFGAWYYAPSHSLEAKKAAEHMFLFLCFVYLSEGGKL